ncbi:MAG: PAS domain S-box protein [Alphaproteobacteria bacterium]|nr:PAS domain S-box protein [Alphaproteobacteria bacterium]MBU1513163.1 PAS domain S-box protein [Alphaproteobacteria bacterium]MBU2095271.1 PAS domain S-box protein [Alphaproteobacteria bacterium]MBU2152186.1 PAS domain S-box protein [Alphaproteobacteria bacterium]MBU2306767.1 PAS domain S-box protein [Alphaproteobacteria bacterium]
MKKAKPDSRADARLAAVLESISDVYYAVDRDWRMVLFNRSAEEFFGMPRGEILGRSLWELFPGRDTEFGRLLQVAMDERKSGRMTAPSALREGRTVEVRIAPLADEGIGVSIDDISERAEAERAMRRSQQRLDLAVEAHGIGIFDWHIPSGHVVWNREQEALFGFAPGTFDGRIEHWRALALPEDAARMGAEVDAAVAAGQETLAFHFGIRRQDGAVRWVEGAARFLYAPDGNANRMVGTNMDITERKLAEQHQRLLINELNHRVKNTLAIVQAMAWQSFRPSGMAKSAVEAFEGRLSALSAAHDVLTRQSWEAASIGSIVAGAVAPHHADDGRLTAEGPAIDLDPKTAVALGLAMHELATNAVKYGALSGPTGQVEVRWTVDGGRLRLTWRESGGPPVAPPSQRGFGARLLEQGLAEELRGSVRLEFRPEGVLCTVEASLGD